MTKRVLNCTAECCHAAGPSGGCGGSNATSNAAETAAAPTEESKEEARAQDIGSTLNLSTPQEDSSEEEDSAEANDPSLHLYSYDSNYGVGAKTTGLPLTTDGDSFSLWLSVPGNVGTCSPTAWQTIPSSRRLRSSPVYTLISWSSPLRPMPRSSI